MEARLALGRDGAARLGPCGTGAAGPRGPQWAPHHSGGAPITPVGESRAHISGWMQGGEAQSRATWLHGGAAGKWRRRRAARRSIQPSLGGLQAKEEAYSAEGGLARGCQAACPVAGRPRGQSRGKGSTGGVRKMGKLA